MIHIHKLLFLLLIAHLAVGCKSSEIRKTPALPFHVAVIPVDVRADDPRTELAGELTDVALAFEESRVSEAMRGALERRCFTSATLLAYPTDVSREEFRALSERERNEYWVRAAKQGGADLIVRGDLDFSPVVHSETNDKFWLNLPLFLLGGPATWFVDDRSYYFDVSLKAYFHDLNPIAEREARLEDENLQLMQVSRGFGESTLDFLDRASGGAGFFALSFVWPAGWIAKGTDSVKGELEDEIVARLCADLAQEISSRPDELVLANRIVDFNPDLKVVTGPDNRQRLTGEVVLKLEGDVDYLKSYSVWMGGELLEEEDFDDVPSVEERGTRIKKYPLSIALPASSRIDTVKLSILDGASLENQRSFTYSVLASARPSEATFKRGE